MSKANSVVFFDGVCNLCNQSVDILIKMDRKKKLKYSSLQGEYAKGVKSLQGIDTNNSFVYLSDGKAFIKSRAIVQILKQLGSGYALLGSVLSIFPSRVLDIFYDFVARNRYRLFGKRDTCRIPTQEERRLFID